MIVEVPLQLRAMPGAPSLADVHAALSAAYAGSPIVSVAPRAASGARANIMIELVGATDRLDLFLFGNEATGQALVVATLDNLGKGAAGAAVQNLNIMAGLPETAGLRL
jgi:N-acetyl-gamma-glutamyl-phosphate reductase